MIWSLCNIKSMTEKDYFTRFQMMSAEKKAKVSHSLAPIHRMQSVTGDYLARQLIAEWFKIKPEEIRFATSEHGKPYAVDLPIHFSISHSEHFVFCAVSDRPIGADIEAIRPINLSTTKRFCNDDELEFIQSDPTRFFEIWTAKEACAKQCGNGLSTMSNFDYFNIKPQLHTIRTNEYVLTIAI